MTKKQFTWLRENQPIEVSWIEPYEGKKPKNFHYLQYIVVEFIGKYIIWKGVYYTYNGTNFDEHHAMYRLHYKDARVIRYRRTR